MFNTLAARLTFLYLFLFSLLSLLVFVVISASLESNLQSRVDDYFLEETGEFATILEQGGLPALRQEIRLESESKGVEQIFFRIYNGQQKNLVVSDLRSWRWLTETTDVLNNTDENPETMMVVLPDSEGKARIYRQSIGHGYMLQIGMLLTRDQLLVERLERAFAIGFIVTLFVGTLVGMYISKKALRGVSKVRECTDLISRGELGQDIVYQDKTREINSLISSVNRMQRQMKKLIQELQDVTNNIAHDLRSPVTRMRVMAETALIGDPSVKEFRHMSGAVVEECDCLVGMINTMLEIAETDAGIRPLDMQKMDLADLLNDVVDLFSVPAEDKQIRLELQLETATLPITGDRSRLQRAFANVLDNALKFTPQGGSVSVLAKPVGEWVIVCISDSGPGILPADLERVCERYYRADRSRKVPGTGLGLSLVQAIVRAHHGELEIVSDGRSGTEVEIRLRYV